MILEKLLTTYTVGFNHLCNGKSRENSGKPGKVILLDLSQGSMRIIGLKRYEETNTVEESLIVTNAYGKTVLLSSRQYLWFLIL